ncbi:hypothetical protein N7532_008893 [Penicillium argentinense]|uniref:NodB homology domain-containing protein n=1 Tax=Penicillium argentinense TaxID=1131581 RepID=A0A9W9K211_9EURO|nr:uncharacterized protein N7532_008893 [Penicillium argentinense]KAJ5090209.1 hypothetical protein N7532_008893 [Penicillium argentinense]
MHPLSILTTVLPFAATLSTAAPMDPHATRAEDALKTRQATTQVAVGSVIDRCTVPGTIALTFDDGPWIYTRSMLNTLAEHGAVATFFLNGVYIDQYPELVQRAVAEGHQIGSHTWSHPYLETLDYASIVSQMTTLEEALTRILGYFPTYMRIPYLMYNDLVLSAMSELQYHVVGTSIDTKDYENDDAGLIWQSFEKLRAGLDAGGSIVLAHDTHYNTVEVLADNILNEIAARGLRTVTVGECLGDPQELWYRTSR